ncbi:MAG: trimethylamine methyltransferase family protein [Eubacteriales bacterium]
MKSLMKLLDDQQIALVHEEALKLLETMGMKFNNDEACQYFKDAGATVEDHVCKIPREIITRCLATAPNRKDFTLYGRTPEQDWKIEDHKPSMHAMTMAVNVLDPITGEVRPATNHDLAKMTQILELMDCVSAASAPVTPQDVPLDAADWYTWATSIKHTTKHITGGCVGKQGVYDAAKMGAIALGSEEAFAARPFLSVWALTSPPLCASENMCNTVMAAAEMGMCNVISSGGMLGMSSPMTMESAFIHTHAEIMAVIALAQLVRPGAPVIYSSFIRSVDMRTMCVGMGSPESSLMRGCMAQMGNMLDLPVQVPTMLRDGKVLDAQAGFETGLGGLVGAMTADYLVTTQLDSDLVVDYADFPFSNECFQQILRVLRPFDFSEERMALDNLAQVGHEGSFMTSMHTFAHWRSELLTPDLVERDNYTNWAAKGSKDIRQKSLERALEIMEKAGEEPLLTKEQCDAIDAVVESSLTKTSRVNQ